MKVSEVVSKTMKIEEGDSFEIYTDGNEQINLKKYSPIQNANVFFKELINKTAFASNMNDDNRPVLKGCLLIL